MKIAYALCLLVLSLPAFAVRPADDNLTFKMAQTRKSQIKSVAYELFFDLSKDATGFEGKALLKVELNRTDIPLSIDSMAKKVVSLKVNGKVINKYPIRKGSFDIPIKYLEPKIEIEVVYGNDYGTTAGGLIRSKDPEDGAEYIYTDFEPYYAHNLFPCFDQPDLKARYTVTVSAPSDWKVIQNELIDSEKKEGQKTVTVFKTTPLLSTYLFFLGAGPFHQWTDTFGELPLHLYARKSLVKYVDAENIFKTTKDGLKFFNEYFGYSYPFSKYAHIFIPEFAWGGMENPGAVTLNERNIFKGPVPASMYAKRDNLLLHEMAHMWFGDLVTMEWWNDLWLNESFATYLASVAEERGLNSKATWLGFLNTKTWGYWQDQLVTTHPIETEVPDVRTAKGNFDGITYAKGASALKQLHFYVGEEGFREGLRAYFQTYAFKNTQRKDFIGAIANASGINLDDWTEKWLKTAGPNRVWFEFSCANGKVKSANIKQAKSVSQTLSPHRTRIAFFNEVGNGLKKMSDFTVTYSKNVTPLPEAIGVNCPDFVLPNVGDQDYAQFSLDKKSVLKAKLALTKLEDPLSRLMLWDILNQMVKDGELSPKDYHQIALEGFKEEGNDLLLGFLLGRRSSFLKNYQLYQTKKDRAGLTAEFEKTIWSRIEKSKAGSSLQMAFFDFYVVLAGTKEAQQRLEVMLVNNTPPKGIMLDQDRRWAIIINLASNGYAKAIKLSEAEFKKDPSTTGERMVFAAQSAWPDLKSKKTVWKRFFTDKDLTYSNFQHAAEYIHSVERSDLSTPFVDDYFKQVTSLDWKSHDDIVKIYFGKLFPVQLCSQAVVDLSKKKLNAAKNLTSIAKRSWLEAQDELERCVRVRR
jgi:aminopeptidase N